MARCSPSSGPFDRNSAPTQSPRYSPTFVAETFAVDVKDHVTGYIYKDVDGIVLGVDGDIAEVSALHFFSHPHEVAVVDDAFHHTDKVSVILEDVPTLDSGHEFRYCAEAAPARPTAIRTAAKIVLKCVAMRLLFLTRKHNRVSGSGCGEQSRSARL